MECPNCGSELPGGSEVCPTCGQVIVNSESEPEPRLSKEGFAAAKAAYKEARKLAGKTYAPHVIAGILSLALTAGGTAFGTLQIVNSSSSKSGETQLAETEKRAVDAESRAKDAETELENAKARIEELEKLVEQSKQPITPSEADANSKDADAQSDGVAEDTGARGDTADQGNSSSSSVEEGEKDYKPAVDEKNYVGLWVGDLKSADSGWLGTRVCYGSQKQPFQIAIKSLDNMGKLNADFRLLYHNHDFDKLDNDVDSHPDDVVLTFNDVYTTINSGEFTYSFSPGNSGTDGNLKIELSVDDHNSTSWRINVKVTAQPVPGKSYKWSETYTLTRASTDPVLPTLEEQG